MKNVWLKHRDSGSDDKRDVGDVCVTIKDDRDRWFSRGDVTTHASNKNANEFVVKPSFDTWSFGVVLFQLCTVHI